MICPICASPMSPAVSELFALPSVTSDCRPWSAGRSVETCEGCRVMRRVVHDLAKEDFARVYDGYKSYPEPEGRTKKILKFVDSKITIRVKSGLDIGSGDGHGLRVLQEHFADANIQGYEPNSTNSNILSERPEGKFDLITLFHVLEHVEDIHEMLGYVKAHLNEDGHVLIQVPSVTMWPFDLVLADHWWHFNAASLLTLLDKCGFQHVDIQMKGFGVGFPIKKEFTVLAKVGAPKPCMPCDHWDYIERPIKWLLSYKTFLDNVSTDVAVIGTGPAAAWAGHILGDKVVCYIDDDQSRWGEFNSKPCKGMHWMDAGDAVVAPFPDWQLKGIKVKNPGLRFL